MDAGECIRQNKIVVEDWQEGTQWGSGALSTQKNSKVEEGESKNKKGSGGH